MFFHRPRVDVDYKRIGVTELRRDGREVPNPGCSPKHGDPTLGVRSMVLPCGADCPKICLSVPFQPSTSRSLCVPNIVLKRIDLDVWSSTTLRHDAMVAIEALSGARDVEVIFEGKDEVRVVFVWDGGELPSIEEHLTVFGLTRVVSAP